MLLKLTRWLGGSRDYRITEGADAAADLLSISGANFRRLKRVGQTLSFTLQRSQCEVIEAALTANCIEYEMIAEHGLGFLVHRYRRRIGIPIGAVLFCLMLWASEQFIWSFEVVGNATVPSDVILSRLDSLGCGVGTYIPSIDFDALHNHFLLVDDSFSWISVNVRGTHASVEVRETVPPALTVDEDTPHNLVASEDGIIEYIEILRGVKVAREEELVRAGELLASGLEEMKHGLRLVHARGTVTARVKRSITIEVPLESTVREATGREFSEKYLNFFGISVKLFANTSNLPANCDKIEREDELSFFDAVTVPITLHETVYREYTEVPITLTEEEARAEAYRQLRERCEAIAADSELVSREINAGLTDGVYVIECELWVVKDIAVETPIYTSNITGEN